MKYTYTWGQRTARQTKCVGLRLVPRLTSRQEAADPTASPSSPSREGQGPSDTAPLDFHDQDNPVELVGQGSRPQQAQSEVDVLIFGVYQGMDIQGFKFKLVEAQLSDIAQGSAEWERDHIRVHLSGQTAAQLSEERVHEISRQLRAKYRWRAVRAESKSETRNKKKTANATANQQAAGQCTSRGRFSAFIQHGLTDVDLGEYDERPPIDMFDSDSEAEEQVREEPMPSRQLRVGSWNIRALTESKLQEIVQVCRAQKIDILALQEIWESKVMSEQEAEQQISVGGYRLLTQKRQGARGGGVGFLVAEVLMEEVEVSAGKFETMWLQVRSGRKKVPLHIGCVYMPVEGKLSSKTDEIYSELSKQVQLKSKEGEVVLLGDFNARVGSAGFEGDNIGQYGEAMINNNGEKLKRFLRGSELFTVNNRRARPAPEWTRRNKNRSQQSIIDYIIVNQTMLVRVVQAGSFRIQEVDIDSTDHSLLLFDVPRAKVKKSKPKKLFKWRVEKLQSEETQERYTEEIEKASKYIENTMDEIVQSNGLSAEEKATGLAALLQREVERIASECVGKKMIIEGRAARWWDSEVRDAVKTRRQVYEKIKETRQGSTETSAAAVQQLETEHRNMRKTVKKMIRAKKQALKDQINEDINEHFIQNNPRAMYAGLKHLTGQKSSKQIRALRDENEGVVQNDKEILEIQMKHYQQLGKADSFQSENFNEEWYKTVEREVESFAKEATEGPDALSCAITPAEVKLALDQSENNKAACPKDGLVNELFKKGGAPMALLLCKLFNHMWALEEQPAAWMEGVIVSLFKGGDALDMGKSYRGISLLNVVGKIYRRVLANRLSRFAEQHGLLHEGQNGFRQGRSTVDHILTLHELVLRRAKAGKPTYVFFLDVQKAYDTVWREGMFHRLWNMGVTGKLWRVIRNSYMMTKSSVQHGGTQSSSFVVDIGVAQGDTLSPILFSLFINSLLQELDDEINQVKGIVLPDQEGQPTGRVVRACMFADDFACAEESPQGLQVAINVAKKHSDKWRYKANVPKCAVMIFGKSSAPAQDLSITWTWGPAGNPIPVSKEYKYLGVMLSDTGGWAQHVEYVLEKGKKKLHSLWPVLSNRALTLALKKRVIESVLRPTLEYGGEVWYANKTQQKQLEKVLLKAARTALGAPKYTDQAVIRGELELLSVESKLNEKRLKFFQMVRGLKNNRLPKIVALLTTWKRERIAGMGPRTLCWHESVKKLMARYNLQDGDISQMETTVISDAIFAHELENWVKDISVVERLAFYGHIKKAEWGMSGWVRSEGSDMGSRALLRFRSGVLAAPWESPDCQNAAGQIAPCPACRGDCAESVAHALLDCPAYENHREVLMTRLTAVCGEDCVHLLQGLSQAEVVDLLLERSDFKAISGASRCQIRPVVKFFLKSVLAARQCIVTPNSGPGDPHCEVDGHMAEAVT